MRTLHAEARVCNYKFNTKPYVRRAVSRPDGRALRPTDCIVAARVMALLAVADAGHARHAARPGAVELIEAHLTAMAGIVYRTVAVEVIAEGQVLPGCAARRRAEIESDVEEGAAHDAARGARLR